ncbi:GNAT family N-acetyltransferase [Tessaracoccus palaemonis]|uniref:GNAT family N-acetyltransferase n=1 Tax=Tessaracoccus palaemonis TaxID=2829499 RepID=A0ABX8SQR7_9ACTN|nr:GNAT family N-acetyltransferase [Tessaracoccus palaemonis]QXT63539.1 GNAT family N-acetyltransferase [Tessaracoccus palaemonis]
MLTIRPASARDIDTITEIYNTAGVGTTASYALDPVSVEDRRAWLEAHVVAEQPVLVLEDDGEVVGYAAYGPFRSLAGYVHTVEHSVYIAEGRRAVGGGRMLMNALIDHALGRDVHVMVGVIDATNEASIEFHRRLGFEETGRLPEVGLKFGQWRTVVFMTLILDGGRDPLA